MHGIKWDKYENLSTDGVKNLCSLSVYLNKLRCRGKELFQETVLANKENLGEILFFKKC